MGGSTWERRDGKLYVDDLDVANDLDVGGTLTVGGLATPLSIRWATWDAPPGPDIAHPSVHTFGPLPAGAFILDATVTRIHYGFSEFQFNCERDYTPLFPGPQSVFSAYVGDTMFNDQDHSRAPIINYRFRINLAQPSWFRLKSNLYGVPGDPGQPIAVFLDFAEVSP